MTVIIRESKPSDYQALVEIYRSTVFKELSRLDKDTQITVQALQRIAENALLVVADVDGQPVGGLGIIMRRCTLAPQLREGEAQVAWFAVAPLVQGKGVGRLLLTTVIAELRRSGRFKRFIVDSQPRFGKALVLYERLGFIRNRRRQSLAQNGSFINMYELDLRN